MFCATLVQTLQLNQTSDHAIDAVQFRFHQPNLPPLHTIEPMESGSMGHGGLFVFFSKRMKCSARPTLLMQVAEINVLLHSAQLPEAQLNHLKVHTFQYALLEISAMDG